MQLSPIDRCSNELCTNRAAGGRMVLMTVPIEEGKPPVALVMCGPCGGSIQKYIESKINPIDEAPF